VNLRCPRCGEDFDLRDAEVLDQLTDEQALYVAAAQGLVRPVGFVAGRIVFAVVDEKALARAMEAVH
jgi:hypothetical protein